MGEQTYYVRVDVYVDAESAGQAEDKVNALLGDTERIIVDSGLVDGEVGVQS